MRFAEIRREAPIFPELAQHPVSADALTRNAAGSSDRWVRVVGLRMFEHRDLHFLFGLYVVRSADLLCDSQESKGSGIFD
jgi:hypothetical protein